MTQDERLAQILPKLHRAEKHLGNLDTAIKEFHATKPYLSAVERDPDTGECVERVTKADPLPVDVSLIAGDAIQNFMSALDHLAYQLALISGGGQAANPKWVYFPVGEDAADYQAKREGKIKGCRQEILDELDSIEPYGGGAGERIWHLKRLNDIEKHRLLFTVAAVLDHFEITMPEDKPAMLKEVESGGTIEIRHAIVRGVEFAMLKEGDIISRFPCHLKLHEYAKGKVGVALWEPGVVPVQGLSTFILESGKEVEKVILRLMKFLE